ncbi:MAG: glycosyltransferase family 2 protein [Eubacterium sp.]|nr:glycosyltransferase family 2 protein [Eubacterium sp.]
MKDEMKVSVILPVKNGNKALLERAIDSVLKQTYHNFEILLINDGSTDEFAMEMKEISEKDERIRFFSVDSLGVSGARNYAIDIAEGDIITFLDGDDTLNYCCFEEAVKILQNSRYDALFGGTYYIYDNKADIAQGADYDQNWVEAEEFSAASSPFRKAYSLEELKKRVVRLTPERVHKTRSECVAEPYRFGDGGYVSRGIAARFIRKSAFQEGFFRFPLGIRLYEDAIWNLMMLEKLKVCYVKAVWYYYFENAASVSNAYNENVINDMEMPIERLSKLMELSDPLEYHAYTRLLMDSLRYIYKCLYGHPDWKPEKSVRKAIKRHLYKDAPWKEIKTLRYWRYSDKKDRLKASLHKRHLLFTYWRSKWRTL